MKLKKRFTVSNLIIFITSVSMIGVISVCFLIAFILKYPVEDLHITRAALLNPVVLSRAIGDFFQDNPSAVKYVIMWFVLCLFTFAVIMTLITRWLSESIQRPIKELTNSADKIRSGDLEFHIMGSSYDEIDALCTSFDTGRPTRRARSGAGCRGGACGRGRRLSRGRARRGSCRCRSR